jgi:hypothetical protein
MELSPSQEAAAFAATQELPNILWNLKVHYRVHNSPPEPQKSNPCHPNLSKIHLDIIYPPTSWSS